MKDNSGKIMLALLAGASAGVIAGLLMAPDSGTATRDSLKKTASKLGKDLEKKMQDSMSKLEGLNAGSLMETASSMLGMNKGGSEGTTNGQKSGVNGDKSGNAGGSASTSGSTGMGSSTSGGGVSGGGQSSGKL